MAYNRLSSGAFEATPTFATAKVGGGSNVTCSDLLDDYSLNVELMIKPLPVVRVMDMVERQFLHRVVGSDRLRI